MANPRLRLPMPLCNAKGLDTFIDVRKFGYFRIGAKVTLKQKQNYKDTWYLGLVFHDYVKDSTLTLPYRLDFLLERNCMSHLPWVRLAEIVDAKRPDDRVLEFYSSLADYRSPFMTRPGCKRYNRRGIIDVQCAVHLTQRTNS